MKKFIGLVGTNSDNSTNRRLLQFMAKHYAHLAEIELLEAKNRELRIGLKVIKRTVIKRFAERLEKEIRYCTDVYGNSIQAINVECANRIIKEMESDKNV